MKPLHAYRIYDISDGHGCQFPHLVLGKFVLNFMEKFFFFERNFMEQSAQ